MKDSQTDVTQLRDTETNPGCVTCRPCQKFQQAISCQTCRQLYDLTLAMCRGEGGHKVKESQTDVTVRDIGTSPLRGEGSSHQATLSTFSIYKLSKWHENYLDLCDLSLDPVLKQRILHNFLKVQTRIESLIDI